MTDYISVWSLIRASGFLAYFFMTISLAFGLLISLSIMKKKKAFLLSYHQTSGWFGLLTIVFHMTLIWKDQFVPYSLTELFIPLFAKNAPVFSALGTVSFYLFLLVIGTSDFFIKKLGRAMWKKVHIAVIPAWVMMVIHGLAIGTDSSRSWALFIYAAGITLILVLAFLRCMESLVLRQSPEVGKVNSVKQK
ncbi:ferric reductase-like transmembrane domain-containing protein [Bacillus sp. EB600]|uniref:ferric reductase-like transmembrane domain-containing protein n=1 Tax=Bacillus sp. EB600 TaxID=2806345 RepID=UPI00210A989F|nr:ferric reductase-like transmembrane domain-containing protein [Bacillus sp. EB600]MCQ6281512.1 ferric reductase-like transmembrane domain-containing protein [Bacillus sp. EB600]